MPQCNIVRSNGQLGVHTFTDGFVPSKKAATAVVVISQDKVLAMCMHLLEQGDAEEADILFERYLILVA